ncbi:MAG: EpsG family protein [Solobacterium sp.]|nr:EpsG family protein [Solobacterium sp.]
MSGRIKESRTRDLILFVLIVSALITRLNIGSDQPSYQFAFQYMFDDPEGSYWYWYKRNPGFYGMNLILIRFIHSYRWYVLAVNLITLGICTYVVLRSSKSILMSILLFMGMGYLEVYYASGIRQMIAMSLFLLAYDRFLRKDRILLYEFICLLALTFHETVLPALVLPLLKPLIRFMREKPAKILLCGTCISVLLAFIMSVIIPRVIPMLGLDWQFWNIVGYLTDVNPSILGIGMECVFGLGVFSIYMAADKDNLDDFTVFSVAAFLFSVFLYIAFCGFSLMSRVADTLQIFVIILFPNLLASVPDIKKRTISLCGAMILNVFLLFMDLKADLPRINRELGTEYTIMNYPYVSVFDAASCEEVFSHYYYYGKE